MKSVSPYYIEGIKDGRAIYIKEGLAFVSERIDNLKRTIKGFAASSPAGQMLRGELDFWRNQVKRAG